MLEWKPMQGAERSICCRYSVCSITQNGVETFEVWRVVPGGAWFAPLQMGIESREKAREIANADAEKRLA